MNAEAEIQAGNRFRFGANWTRFLAVVDEARITEAEKSLREMLGVTNLQGRRFLDIGCGSGLFSLAARRLGAEVHSFDFDLQSVACAQELKRRYFREDSGWRVEEGSVLDSQYVERLGKFDVVYSWGVLHHTGSMWVAIENAINRVANSGGTLFIAIYNDQGWKSHVWWFVKFLHNRAPRFLRGPFAVATTVITHILVTLKQLIRLQPLTIISSLFRAPPRGMSAKYDMLDWIGGFPYEFATFETLNAYLGARGFTVRNARRCTSLGCHELVCQRTACAG
jgi:2-polyprenyl-6-hydroxyphenyl methylase/3-demethylubiquinone-9 3-methyltransferase